MLFLNTLVIFSVLLIGRFQIVPESVQITVLPDQTQAIYHGWLKSADDPESYLYYQLFLADGTNFDDPLHKISQNPLLIYLEGGPGQASVVSAWDGFGPYGVKANINFTGNNTPENFEFDIFKRDSAWTQFSHLLVIDSPIQTGFSFSMPEDFSNDTADAVDHLVTFLRRFYDVYPQLLDTSLYIMGNSYGGHWAAYFPYVLLRDNKLTLDNGRKINLVGSIFLTPLIDAKFQVEASVSDYLLAAGVTDLRGRDILRDTELQVRKYVETGESPKGRDLAWKEINMVVNMEQGEPITSDISQFNSRLDRELNKYSLRTLKFYLPAQHFFNTSIPLGKSARSLLNVPDDLNYYIMGYGSRNFGKSSDFVLELSYGVEYLLDQGIRVLMVGAQDDNGFPAMGLVNLVGSLKWNGAKGFREAGRKFIRSEDGDVLATKKEYQNLNLVVINNSGHVLGEDQPMVVFDVLEMHIQNPRSSGI